MARGLIDALSAMRELPDAFRKASAELESLPLPRRPAHIAESLDSLNRRINSGLGPWFSEFQTTSTVPDWTIALLSCFAALGDTQAPLLRPILVAGDAQVGLRVIALN
jgi:hypothetical protein